MQQLFSVIIRGEAALGRPVSAATLCRIHATLRAALNAAVRVGLITSHSGRWPELPAATRSRPDERALLRCGGQQEKGMTFSQEC